MLERPLHQSFKLYCYSGLDGLNVTYVSIFFTLSLLLLSIISLNQFTNLSFGQQQQQYVANSDGLNANVAGSRTTSIHPPAPTATGGVDKFGIKELYPTKSGGGEEWFMNMQDPNHDTQTNPQTTLTKNSDGSYKINSTQVRYEVFTSSGYHQDQITTYDQQQLAAKGYMQSPNDWKNVEITGYFKVNSYTSSIRNGAAHIELLARGGTHSSPVPCEGTAYHSNTYQTGNSRFEKELEYPQGYTSDYPDQATTSPLQGRGWIGLKAVFYNMPNGSVKLEQWIDDGSDNINTPGNNWHKLLEYTDSGNWGGGTTNCGGTDITIITWGGPMVFFRWDNIDDMDVKNFSVREIHPPAVS